MLYIRPEECQSCSSFDSLLKSIDCTILDMSKNKYYSLIYNSELYFDESLFKQLLRYKRILNNRIVKPKYGNPKVDAQDLIGYVKRLIYKENCSLCQDCFPELSTTTTTLQPGSTTTYTSTSTSTSTTII